MQKKLKIKANVEKIHLTIAKKIQMTRRKENCMVSESSSSLFFDSKNKKLKAKINENFI